MLSIGIFAAIIGIGLLFKFGSQLSTYWKDKKGGDKDAKDKKKGGVLDQFFSLVMVCFAGAATLGVAVMMVDIHSCIRKDMRGEIPAQKTVYVFPIPAATTQPQTNSGHPRSGSGFASKSKPLRVWLNPRFAGTYPSDDAQYCNEEHPDVCIIDKVKRADRNTIDTWRNMPEGWYIVTPFNPLSNKEISFRWD
jgi:hypothetical protein